MAEYDEEFRDNYKNLRQSNDQKLKLNGATFRNIRNLSKIGNLITKTEVAPGSYNPNLDELNDRYDLNQSNVVYSLNKKKRWEVGPKLVSHMKDFVDDDQDVRLYETRNRYQKKANCIAVHRSKGDKLTVKSTYANIDSIKQAQILKEQAEKNPTPTTTTAIKEYKKKKNVNSIVVQEEIVIDGKQNTTADIDPYIQYDIEYSPKRDILKYGAKKVNSTGTLSGSRSKKVQLKNSLSDDYQDILDDEEYYSEEEEPNEPAKPSEESDEEFQVPLEDLIYNYAIMLLEKQERAQQANKQKIKEEILGAKDRKVYVNKNEILQYQQNNHEAQDSTNATKKVKCPKPVPTDLLLNGSTIESTTLKQVFGDKYSEADNCWPRHFNINLSKEIAEAFNEKKGFNKFIDVRLWLTFQQKIGDNSAEVVFNTDSLLFTVSVCSNLVKKVDITFLNPEETWNVQDLCKAVVETISNFYFEAFRPVTEASNTAQYTQFRVPTEDLPNIAEKVLAKNLEDLKLEMVNKTLSTAAPTLERMNSREVTKTDQDFNEQEKIQARLDKIFAEKGFECAICYDQKDTLQDCVVIKSCGHGVCKSCIKSYADYELKNAFMKAGKFSCPTCDNEIGLALLINLSTNAQEVDQYIEQTIERIYLVLSNFKWCSSASCSRILQVDLTSNPYGTISCSCGFQMCLKCNNKPHFPAKCSQIANYYRLLKKMNEFNFNDTAYNSRGKRCPKCHVFMEKNGGCNQMNCTICKEQFCWNCVLPWKDHLKLNNNQHSCRLSSNNQSINFKVTNVKLVPDKMNAYEDSFVHRRMRKFEEKRRRADGATRLLSTVKQAHYDEMIAGDQQAKQADQAVSWTQAVIEKGHAYANWRKEIRGFLDNLLLLVSELHFVCEHGHLSLKDPSLPKNVRLQLSGIIKSLEIIIWNVEYNLAEGKGLKSIHQLRQLYQKGLNCIASLKKIKLD